MSMGGSDFTSGWRASEFRLFARYVERAVATVAECSTDRYTVVVQAARELPPER